MCTSSRINVNGQLMFARGVTCHFEPAILVVNLPFCLWGANLNSP